jgi:hypothetical protein
MPNLDSSDLRDPQPPIPGRRERTLVARRAHQLGRRRRLAQGGSALAVVAVATLSVAALTGGGTSGPTGNRIEAASADTFAPATTTPAPTADTVPATTAPPVTAPVTQAPQETPTTAAPVQPVQGANVPATFTLSGVVTGNPSGTRVTLTISGPGGQLDAAADATGHFSVSGLGAGDYQVVGQWEATSGTATGATRFGTVAVNADTSVTFSF